jgi:HK97 family phage portal protein
LTRSLDVDKTAFFDKLRSGIDGVRDRLGGALMTQKGSLELLEKYFLSDFSFPGIPSRILKPYSEHTWVHAVERTVAMNGAQVPFRIRDRRTNALVESDPIVDLYRDVNPHFSRFQLFEATIIFTRLFGQCIWLYEWLEEKPGSRSGPPHEIWVFPPDRWSPIMSGGQVIGWRYQAPGHSPEDFMPDEVTRFWTFNPYDTSHGHPTVKAAMKSVAMDYAARIYERMLLENSAIPQGYLSTKDKIGKERARELQHRWEEVHRGPHRAGKIAVIEGGLSYEQTAMSLRDLQANQMHKSVREEVCATGGVPPGCVGVMEYANYSNLSEQITLMWRQTIRPLLIYIQEVLDTSFFQRYAPNLKGEFDFSVIPELQLAMTDKVAVAERLFKNGIPWRKIEDLLKTGIDVDDLDIADESFIPLGLVQPGVLGDEEPKKGLKKVRTAVPSPGKEKLGGLLEEYLKADKDTEAPGSLAGTLSRYGISRAPRDPDRTQAAIEFYRSLIPLRNKCGKKVETFFYQHRRKVITALFDNFARMMDGVEPEGRAIYFQRKADNDKLRARGIEPRNPEWKNDALEQIIAEILPSADEQAGILWEATGTLHKEAVGIGGTALYGELSAMGLDIGEFLLDEHSLVVDYLAQKQMQSRVVVTTLHGQLKEVLSRGLMEGQSVEKIADAIRGVYKQAGGRAITIARTEIVGSANNSRYLTQVDTGIQIKGWAHGATRGEPRPWHEAIDGEVVGISEHFSIGLLHPHDWVNGGCEDNCNCTCTLYTPTYDPKTGHEFTLEEIFGEERALKLWKRFGSRIKLPTRFKEAVNV